MRVTVRRTQAGGLGEVLRARLRDLDGGDREPSVQGGLAPLGGLGLGLGMGLGLGVGIRAGVGAGVGTKGCGLERSNGLGSGLGLGLGLGQGLECSKALERVRIRVTVMVRTDPSRVSGQVEARRQLVRSCEGRRQLCRRGAG